MPNNRGLPVETCQLHAALTTVCDCTPEREGPLTPEKMGGEGDRSANKGMIVLKEEEEEGEVIAGASPDGTGGGGSPAPVSAGSRRPPGAAGPGGPRGSAWPSPPSHTGPSPAWRPRPGAPWCWPPHRGPPGPASAEPGPSLWPLPLGRGGAPGRGVSEPTSPFLV